MNFCDINPHIRFAEYTFYSSFSQNPVFVKDCRFFYCLSGKADIFIENEHYELMPDCLFYCNAGNIYNMQSNGIELIALNFDLTQKDKHITGIYSKIAVTANKPAPTMKIEIINDSDYINTHLFLTDAEFFLDSFKKILQEFSTQKIYYHEISSAILKSILAKLHRNSIESAENSTTTISQIIEYIKDNFNQPLTNAMLSDMSGYHVYHLNRLFKKHTGISIHKYILNIRINAAKKLLLNTNHSLTIIAEKVGFNSNTHFSTYFKQMVGITPSDFREQFKSITIDRD